MSDAETITAETPSSAPSSRAGGGLGAVALRVGVSVGALALVLSRIPLSEVAAALRGLAVSWVVAAFVLVYAAIVVSAYKWQVLLKARGHALGLARLTRHYLVGLFFNNFLPTSVGGDVVRAWDAGRDLDDAPEGAASVIAERLIASLGLGLTAALALPFAGMGGQVAIAVAVVVGSSLVLIGMFLAPSRSEAMMRTAMGGRFESVTDWACRAVHGVDRTLRDPVAVAVVLALSVLFQVLVALVVFAVFRALGASVGVGECVACVSVISAITMVPVSISGHGVREAGFVYFFTMAGVSAAVAVTASLLFFLAVAVGTLPGAVLFMAGRRRGR